MTSCPDATLVRITLQVAVDPSHADPEGQADTVEAIAAAADSAVPWATVIGAITR